MNRYVAAGAFAMALLVPLPAFATAQRTFVASAGNDGYPCTLSQPCRSFATAIGKTADKGEVIVLDSAGYGPFTITQSVSVIAPAGVYAGVTVTSGAGITIDGSAIAVTLRGLSVNGQGGTTGILFAQGAALTVDGCEVANLNPSGTGIEIYALGSRTTIQDAVIRNNGAGVEAIGSDQRVTIAHSTIAENYIGVNAIGGPVAVTVAHSLVTGSVRALSVSGSPIGGASILSDGNTITHSDIVFHFIGGAMEFIYTAGNNTVGYYNILVQPGGTLTPCCAI